jgi:hypothetical protein
VEHQDHRRDQRHVYQEDGFVVGGLGAEELLMVNGEKEFL